MQANLPNEMHQIWCQSERQVSLGGLLLVRLGHLDLVVLLLNIIKRLIPESLGIIQSLKQLSVGGKVKAARSFTEIQSRKFEILSLVESIREERVDGVILRELLLKQELDVVVVEDAIEVRLQQVGFDFGA